MNNEYYNQRPKVKIMLIKLEKGVKKEDFKRGLCYSTTTYSIAQYRLTKTKTYI